MLFFSTSKPNHTGIFLRFSFIFSRNSELDLPSFEIISNHSFEKLTAFQKNIKLIKVDIPVCLDLVRTIFL